MGQPRGRELWGSSITWFDVNADLSEAIVKLLAAHAQIGHACLACVGIVARLPPGEPWTVTNENKYNHNQSPIQNVHKPLKHNFKGRDAYQTRTITTMTRQPPMTAVRMIIDVLLDDDDDGARIG